MTDSLPAWPLFTAFLLASLALALTPGPGVLYIVSRSLTHGPRTGLLSVIGIALGNFVNALAASLGLAVVFSLSSFAFSLVKYAGALYLIYLGIRLLRAPPSRKTANSPEPTPSQHALRDGLIVALLNPKTTLFFAAFLPQFYTPGASPVLQGTVLGTLFVLIAAMTDTVYALTAAIVSRRLRTRRIQRFSRHLGGGVFIGLGILTALSGSRHTK